MTLKTSDAFGAFNEAAPDLDGELGSVLAPGEQVQASTAYGPRRSCGMKTRRMSRGLAAEPLRHQEVDALPDELVAFVTKQSFAAGVHQHDVTLRVDQDDAVR